MKTLFTILLYVFPFYLLAQDTIKLATPLADKERYSIYKELDKGNVTDEFEKRETNLEFYKTQVLITEPGTLSGLCVTDFTINSNDSLQKKPYVLNGDILLPISFGGKKWGLNTIHFIPEVKIRIFSNDKSLGDSSLPVRTPSYMPTLIYYFSIDSFSKNEDNHRSYCFGGFKAFHHSNGQDGNEFDTMGNINTYNGNFGENLAFELVFGKTKEFDVRNPYFDKPNALYYYKIGFEYHPDFLSNQEFSQYNIYGRNRLNFQAGALFMKIYNEYISTPDKDTIYQVVEGIVKERLRFIFNISYITDIKYYRGQNINNLRPVPFFSTDRINVYGTAYYIIPGSVNAAAFMQVGYWASDTYNMYFQQSIFNFRFGLAFAFFKYPKSGDLKPPVYIG